MFNYNSQNKRNAGVKKQVQFQKKLSTKRKALKLMLMSNIIKNKSSIRTAVQNLLALSIKIDTV